MTEDLLAALEQGGATLVTANARLARSLRQEFGVRQLERGRTAWLTPAILPWPVFVQRLWEAQAPDGEAPVFTPVQEQALWESIVEASPESAGLIQPQAAARLAGEAWRLIQEWRIPLGGRKHKGAWEATAETSAFFGWAQQFQFHVRWLDRADPARLPEMLLSRALAGPREVWLAGFDELTPRQLELLGALGKYSTRVVHYPAAGAVAPAPMHGGATLAALADSDAEVEAAAAWCRACLAANARARIGVVVQDLEERRHRFERAFRLATPGAFHIALGPPLDSRPMIAAALRLLDFGGARVSWDAVNSLLLSPWVGGFAAERSRRAACDVALRRLRASELAVSDIARLHACPPVLARALWQVDSLARTWPEEQKPGAWSQAFADVMDAFGWPGDEAAASEEYQLLEAWRALLGELASTDLAVQQPVSRRRALAMLRRLAAGKRFEVESRGEPIQIMGALESAGTRLDHLWIAGMNDEVWPARPRPNPFIPLALQRQYNLPHSSAARELEFAARVSGRLLQAAPSGETVVSYARADSERELAPSPLFAHLAPWPIERAPMATPAAEEDWRGAVLETINDTDGPAVAADAITGGGTRALELQAKCPFRAFAEIRLGARSLDDPEPGLDPRERGGFLHSALEFFWKRFPSSAALRAASEDVLAEVLAASVDQALAAHPTGGDGLAARLIELERVRLIELAASWIELEKRREIEFTVEEPEQERTVEIGGLTVQVRLDRLDKLATGGYALVDYKSRAPRLADWDGERPESPQLPIYAVTAGEPLAALAFAQVRTGENLFKGYATVEGALPGAKLIEPAELAGRIAEWRRVLGELGRDFRAGRAGVDPKDRFKTCEICHLTALCRVNARKGETA